MHWQDAMSFKLCDPHSDLKLNLATVTAASTSSCNSSLFKPRQYHFTDAFYHDHNHHITGQHAATESQIEVNAPRQCHALYFAYHRGPGSYVQLFCMSNCQSIFPRKHICLYLIVMMCHISLFTRSEQPVSSVISTSIFMSQSSVAFP